MRKRGILYMTLGLLVAVMTVKLTAAAVSNARKQGTPGPLMDVVVASRDISPSERIVPGMLIVKETPRTPLLPLDAYTAPEGLQDMVSHNFIPVGTPITPAMLDPEGAKILRSRIPKGYRAVAIAVDEPTGVAYHVQPGSYVDVSVAVKARGTGSRREAQSTVFLRRVKVAAVGQTLDEAGDRGSVSRVRSVTLVVRDEDVATLHLAQTEGRLTLAMCPLESEQAVDGQVATIASLLGRRTVARAATALPCDRPAETGAERPESPRPAVLEVNSADARVVTFSSDSSLHIVTDKPGRDMGAPRENADASTRTLSTSTPEESARARPHHAPPRKFGVGVPSNDADPLASPAEHSNVGTGE